MTGINTNAEPARIAKVHTGEPEAPAAPHMRDEIEPPWVKKAGVEQAESKDALARYVARHFVRYGMVVFMGPGTTNNRVAQSIFDFQIDSGTPLDLAILTNNLTIFALGADHGKKHPDLFRTTQIISTGGTFQHSINSVVGRFAAQAIESSVLRPHLVLLGASGVSFESPDGGLTYHFEDELEAQSALGTCHTDHRILVCDHSKLGSSKRWRGCTLRALLSNTSLCTIVTSCPKDDAPADERASFQSALTSFKRLVEGLRTSPDNPLTRTTLRLQVVNASGECIDQLPEQRSKPTASHARVQRPHVVKRRRTV